MTNSSANDPRPSKIQTYMEVAYAFRQQSTCARGQVGAVLVVGGRIIGTGYNGSPPGDDHCITKGCLLTESESGCQRAIHAEANAIAFAARHGVRCEGAHLYSTAGPCLKCAQLIVAAGIARVVYDVPYRLQDGIELLIRSKVEVQPYAQTESPTPKRKDPARFSVPTTS